MFESSFSKLRMGKSKITEATMENQAWQDENLNQTGKEWPISTNAEVSYFSDEYDEEHVSFAGLESHREVFERLRNMRMTGEEKIVGIDLMGKGQECINVGCDKVFSLTLSTPGRERNELLEKQELSERGVSVQYGDLFDSACVDDLIETLDESLDNEGKLGVVFFRPWGGMERYENNLYSHLYLYKHVLRPLYERLSTNGVIFAELFHLPDDEFETLVEHLRNNGIWLSSIHQTRESDPSGGRRLLKIEKPLVVEQEIPSAFPR